MSNQTSAHKEFINAAKEGELRAVQALLNAGALEDVNCHDVNGYTALHWASWEGHTEIVRVLLACPGVNVNKQGETQNTALLFASAQGHTEIVRLLLACRGVDVDLQNVEGNRALDSAKTFEIQILIRSHVALAATLTATIANNAAPAPAPAPAAPALLRPVPTSWLAARLLYSGYDVAVARDCEQILVLNEGFVREGDWLECPPTVFNSAYLTSIGITGLGLQRHLVKLHSQLRPIYMKSSNPTWQEENH